MGCTSSKPSANINPSLARPARTQARPLHPSAHHSGSLPNTSGNYSSNQTDKHVPKSFPKPPRAGKDHREMAVRLKLQQANDIAANGGKDSKPWPNRTSRAKGGSKGWHISDGYVEVKKKDKSNTPSSRPQAPQKNENPDKSRKKPDQYLKYAYPPCPGPPPCRPIPGVPKAPKSVPVATQPKMTGKPITRKPVPVTKQSKKTMGKHTVLWEARHQTRLPPMPGPPPNKPLPLLPIAHNGNSRVTYTRGHPSYKHPPLPPQPGPSPTRSLPKVPMLEVRMGKRKDIPSNRATTVLTPVSPLGPPPERLWPHIYREPIPVSQSPPRMNSPSPRVSALSTERVVFKGHWAPLNDIGRSS